MHTVLLCILFCFFSKMNDIDNESPQMIFSTDDLEHLVLKKAGYLFMSPHLIINHAFTLVDVRNLISCFGYYLGYCTEVVFREVFSE